MKQVCEKCHKGNVFYDSYVNVNDPTDVRTFDAVFCEDCGGETALIDVDEEMGECDDCGTEYVLGSDDHDGERGLCWECSRPSCRNCDKPLDRGNYCSLICEESHIREQR